MLKLLRDGELVSAEASVNGRARASVILWRRDTEDRLAVEALNLVARREREALLETLPSDVRVDARRVLEALAVEVVQRADERGEGPAYGTPFALGPNDDPFTFLVAKVRQARHGYC